MELQKINVKFFVAEPDQVPLTAFIDIFHSWIQATDGIYYDVADYSHMHNGPGILMIAHEANISIDETGGQRGLLYNRKQPLDGSNQEKLRCTFRAALENCLRLEQEPSLQGKLKFRGDKGLFLINDRLLAPNTEETFLLVRDDLEGFLGQLYRGVDYSLARNLEPTERFSVWMNTAVPCEVAELLKNLEA
ncbi:MAG: hypothetical protein HYT78_09640 [Deltaproteobacteria bacterium]|nr:hypothetical protein [Deltaproteobacteria bacterium]